MIGHHRDPVTVSPQRLDDEGSRQCRPGATHVDSDLGVACRRIQAVLTHDDGLTGRRRFDGEQHVVAEELGGDHGPTVAAAPASSALSEIAVATKLFTAVAAPVCTDRRRRRTGPVCGPGRAVGPSGRDGAGHRDAISRNSAVNRSAGWRYTCSGVPTW